MLENLKGPRCCEVGAPEEKEREEYTRLEIHFAPELRKTLSSETQWVSSTIGTHTPHTESWGRWEYISQKQQEDVWTFKCKLSSCQLRRILELILLSRSTEESKSKSASLRKQNNKKAKEFIIIRLLYKKCSRNHVRRKMTPNQTWTIREQWGAGASGHCKSIIMVLLFYTDLL